MGGGYKPTAAKISNHQMNLRRILRNLPYHERICMIPFEHKYTTASLARLGLNALKGKDRDSYKAIGAASDGAWKFIVVQASKTDMESGGGSHWGGFDVEEVNPGEPDFNGQAFGADGSDSTADLAWLRKIADFRSVEDGGMLLLPSSDDDLEAMWGDGDSGSVEYTGNEGATRETTYRTFLLVAFDAEKEFEMMISGDLARCIEAVATEKDDMKTVRLLNHISRSRSTISYVQLERLLPLVLPSTATPSTDEIAKLKTLFDALTMKESDVITKATFAFLDWITAAKDSCPEVQVILKEFFSRPTPSASTLLLKADMAAYLVTKPSCESLLGLLAAVTNSFQPRSQIPTPSYPYSQGYYARTSAVTSDQAMKIANFVKKYSWALAKDTALALLRAAVEKEITASLASFERTLDILISLMEIASGDADFHRLCDVVATKCANDIVYPKLFQGYHSRRSVSSSFLLSNATIGQKAFKLLLNYGNAGWIDSLQAWVISTGCPNTLEVLERMLRSVDESTTHAHKEAVKNLLGKLKHTIVEKKLATLTAKRDRLVRATRSAPPPFSWCMPEAYYPQNSQIQEFLRGPQPSQHFIVGGGINNARRMSGRHIQPTFSATISTGSGTGQNANVTVTKTKDYYDCKVKKYKADSKELMTIDNEIRRLGGSVIARGSLVDLPGNQLQERPAKKAKATMPEGVEVIAID